MKLIEYDGVVNALAEAERLGFGGRFLYMTASGIGRRSVLAACLNLYKGNTLLWRRRAEAAIRKEPGRLPDRPRRHVSESSEWHASDSIGPGSPPAVHLYRIARGDVVDVFVAALGEVRARARGLKSVRPVTGKSRIGVRC